MVLSDQAIRRLIEAGRIGIDPYDPALMQPSARFAVDRRSLPFMVSMQFAFRTRRTFL